MVIYAISFIYAYQRLLAAQSLAFSFLPPFLRLPHVPVSSNIPNHTTNYQPRQTQSGSIISQRSSVSIPMKARYNVKS